MLSRSPARLIFPALPCVVVSILLALVLAACGQSPASASSAPAPGTEKPTVVCTTGMVADLVRRVGGDRVRVIGLMGEGVDPHLYKASPGDVRLLSDAAGVFYNGLHLEGKMGDILENLARRKPVIPIAAKLPESRLRSPPQFAGNHDPHVWFDVSLWALTIPEVEAGLTRVDPAGAQEFAQRARALEGELAALHQEVLKQAGAIPADKRVLVTAHDAFGYFAIAYGFEVHGIQGISTESEASLKDINSLVDLLVARKIPAVFVESSVPRKMVDALVEGAAARGHAVRVGGQLFSDAMGRDGTPEGTYPGMVRHNVKTIVDALAAPAANPGGAP